MLGNTMPQKVFSPKKKIFITGVAGFIGFHLATHLKSFGVDVFGCDSFNSYYDPMLKRARASLLKEIGIDVFGVSIQDKEKIAELVQRQQPTHIVHLAAQAGVRYSLVNPLAYVDANVDGFVKMLEIAKDFGALPFIYASSSSVYGQNTKIPFSEEDPTDAPSNLYGATKKSNELIAAAYHHVWKIPVTGLRFFTVYGPWGRPDMAYYLFTKAIVEGSCIPLFGGGLLRRDFTYISDIVDGITSAIELAAPLEIFNLGHNSPHSVLDLVAVLEKHIGKKAIIEHKPLQPGEVMQTYADICKSSKILGFSPRVSLEEGMGHFVSWYRSHHRLK
jgi:UDP-glucuronate 4-epimerase